jgi:hypothetical protein
MNRHLSSEQISKWVIGDRTPEAERHAGECAACRGEIERLQGSLTLFRGAVRQLSGGRVGMESRAAWTPPGRWTAWNRHGLRWAAMAAMVTLLGVFPAYKSWENSRRIATAKQDAVLLEQVDAELARSVPQP